LSRTLAQWLAYQQGTHGQSIDLSLERVRVVAQRLQLLTDSCPAVIIAGTNGKGSTATTLAALLHACDQHVGLFTSPHLVRYRERIQIDGVPAEDAALVAAFERIEAERGGITLTFFEYNTLAALLLFRESAVDRMVLEVGLGGRLDATNIIDAEVAVLCSVGLDHREYLGSTLQQIGAEKAGVFRRGQAVVLGDAELPTSVWDAARALDCRVYSAGREYFWQLRSADAGGAAWDYRGPGCAVQSLPAPTLAGAIQYRNAAVALTALLLTGADHACERARIAAGLRAVALPGRFQIIPGSVEWIIDVAHNEPAAQVLAAALLQRPCTGRTLAVAGMLGDKDVAAVARALDPAIDHWLLAGIEDEARGLSAAALRARLPELRAPVELAGNVAAACVRARELARPHDRVLVFGSFHVAGPALEWLGIY
jgi:dihydrofolate synthase/folylpolyglutamate synthase